MGDWQQLSGNRIFFDGKLKFKIAGSKHEHRFSLKYSIKNIKFVDSVIIIERCLDTG